MVLSILILMGVGLARADSIRLHDQIGTSAARVTLRDVAELEGAYAQTLGDTVVAEIRAGQDQARVDMDSIRRVLTESGVNWARLSLRGYATCRVSRVGEQPEPIAQADQAAASNPDARIDLNTHLTLEAEVLGRIRKLARVRPGDMRVTFSDRDRERLARPLATGPYEIVSKSAATVGRMPFTIRRYDRMRVAQTFTVTPLVERRALALVARHSIGKGDPFTSQTVEVREVYLSADRGEPISDDALLLGQTSARLLRQGTVIYPKDVKARALVSRGDTVTVRCFSGGLLVQIVASALEDGALDDLIQLRHQRSRERFTATVTGSRQVAIRPDPGRERLR